MHAPADPPANRTLANGLRLLELIASQYRPFSLSEIAEAMGLPKSHIHRLLQTLVEAGFVAQSETSRKYRADVKLLELAGSVADQMPLRVHGGPVLRALSEAAKSPSYLIVPHQGSPMVIKTDFYRGRTRSNSLGLGNRLSLHGSAAGKLFLAFKKLPVPTDLPKLGPNTITDPRRLKAELEAIRRHGCSINRLENNESSYSFAAPVYTGERELFAAVGVAAMRTLVEAEGEAHFVHLVVEAADNLSSMNLTL